MRVNWRAIGRVLTFLNVLIGITMAIPLILSAIYAEDDLAAITWALLVTLAVNGPLVWWWWHKPGDPDHEFGHREGLLLVAVAWVSVSLFAALPFWFYGFYAPAYNLEQFTNAYFEAVSGLTTTGATTMRQIAPLPHGLMWWRHVLHWYGGMGIVLLSVAILPLLGAGGLHLYKAETPGPTKDKMTPLVRDTARILFSVYGGITVAGILLLWLGAGMSLFDACCHCFSALATGGFSTKNSSLMDFQSPLVEIVVFVIVFAGAVNFTLHVKAFKGDWKVYFRDAEFRWFVGIWLFLSWFCVWGLWHGGDEGLLGALRHGTLNTLSLLSTAGFNTADFETYSQHSPAAFLALFFALMAGGMVGSTAGGIKVLHLMVVAKVISREFKALIHPHSVNVIKIGGHTMSETAVRAATAYMLLFVATWLAATTMMCGMDVDFLTAISAAATTLGNTGPGFGAVGPMDNFGDGLPTAARWVCIFCMIAGRLELFTVLVVLSPEFWRR